MSAANMTAQWCNVDSSPGLQQIARWLDEGRVLIWRPILSRENFPAVAAQTLQKAEHGPWDIAWPIARLGDFLALPEGMTGWLTPVGEDDSAVAVGLWHNTLHVCEGRHRPPLGPVWPPSGKGSAPTSESAPKSHL